MRGSVARLSAVLAAAVLTVGMLAVPALAQYPPGEDTETSPDASFACEGLVAGTTATCSIGGWEPDSEVSVSVTETGGTAMAPLATIGLTLAQAGETVYADTLTADANGFVSYSFDVPDDPDATLAFTHNGLLADGTPYSHTATREVAAAGDGGTDDGAADDGLATTGEMISLLGLMGVLALAAGVVTVRRSRLREATSEPTSA